MRVVATERGYFGGLLREQGEQFEVPDKSKAKWFKPVNAKEPPKRAAAEDAIA